MGLGRADEHGDLRNRYWSRPGHAHSAAGAAGLLIAGAIALAGLLLHVLTSGRYGYFRDELYFIACAHHLAWGYVDQPPLVAVAAWASSWDGYGLLALRAPAVLAAALTIWLTGLLAREFGGGRFAQGLAALAALFVPAYLLLGNILATTSFDPLFWMLLLYCLVRLIRTGDERWWIGAGAAFVLGFYAKYTILGVAISIAIGLLCTPQRRILRSRILGLTAVACAVAIAPNVWWQWSHHWPFAGVVTGDFVHRHASHGIALEYKNVLKNAVAFAAEQLLYTGPVIVPLWIAGLWALVRSPRFSAFRWIAIAYAFLMACAIVLEAKGYYVTGIYAVLLAAGAVTAETALRSTAARSAIVAVLLAGSVAVLPLSVPVLPIPAFLRYSQIIHLTGTPPHVMQPLYAEEFGWRGLTARVAQIYWSLPPDVRVHTGIFADTYGDAGALAFYGPRYHLPAVISSQNTYSLWGTAGYDGRSLIVVGATQADLIRAHYRNMRLIATYLHPNRWATEGPDPIYLCSDPVAPLAQWWSQLRWYGA